MQGAAAKNGEPVVTATDPYRLRLLEGLAASVSERGYAATTIAHVVKAARVSRRTFYERFEDKEACFIALYVEASSLLQQAVEAALRQPALRWQDQLEAGIDAYLGALAQDPGLTRSVLVEIQAAGPRALDARLAGRARFAAMLRAFVDRTREQHPQLRPLTPAMATALVGGIDELLLVRVESGDASSLGEVRETASELIRAAVGER
ncbi:MAG: Transcriptional regulator, TetR family [Labilithrix sp.]|nr:Transcriptional regulator, TetR family [Labilithrix sp.]